MTTYVPFDRDQPFLLPPDLKDWLPEDDIAHFIVAAADRVRLGTVAIKPAPAKAGGTKIDANASRIRSVRGACPRAGRRPDPWDWAQALRAKLAADIAELTAKAEAADAEDCDPQALPAEITRRAG